MAKLTAQAVHDFLVGDAQLSARAPIGTVYSATVKSWDIVKGLRDRKGRAYDRAVLTMQIDGWERTTDFHISFNREAKLRAGFLKLGKLGSTFNVVVTGHRVDEFDVEWENWQFCIPESRKDEYQAWKKVNATREETKS